MYLVITIQGGWCSVTVVIVMTSTIFVLTGELELLTNAPLLVRVKNRGNFQCDSWKRPTNQHLRRVYFIVVKIAICIRNKNLRSLCDSTIQYKKMSRTLPQTQHRQHRQQDTVYCIQSKYIDTHSIASISYKGLFLRENSVLSVELFFSTDVND